MAKFKIVKHRFKYHVIAFEGTKEPRKEGKAPNYKEQCVSSHWTIEGAEKAKSNFENRKLEISSKNLESKWSLVHWFREVNIAIGLAVLAAVVIDILLKTYGVH